MAEQGMGNGSGNTPKHIGANCLDCGAVLVRDSTQWADEFYCSAGCEGCYLDWPDEVVDELLAKREASRGE